MKLIFASDSFKGSLRSIDIANMLDKAAKKRFPEAQTVLAPVADGGEGTVEALVTAARGEISYANVTAPLMNKVRASYGIIHGDTAVIELAQASGLPLVSTKDPLRASSFGTGELMLAALRGGAKKLLMGIGGSATNDLGMGLLAALGVRFTDESGRELPPCGESMAFVRHVALDGLSPLLRGVPIDVLCDVCNPLLGKHGATAVYGPQKGVTDETFPILENGMAHLSKLLEQATGRSFAALPGAGAAGGAGAALTGVLGARLQRGADAVLDAIGFDELLDGASLVVTGEGRLDEQSVAYGKVVASVARRCAAKKVPVVALVGGMTGGAEGLYELAKSSIFTVVNAPMPERVAMDRARELYECAADRLFRMIQIGMEIKEREKR